MSTPAWRGSPSRGGTGSSRGDGSERGRGRSLRGGRGGRGGVGVTTGAGDRGRVRHTNLSWRNPNINRSGDSTPTPSGASTPALIEDRQISEVDEQHKYGQVDLTNEDNDEDSDEQGEDELDADPASFGTPAFLGGGQKETLHNPFDGNKNIFGSMGSAEPSTFSMQTPFPSASSQENILPSALEVLGEDSESRKRRFESTLANNRYLELKPLREAQRLLAIKHGHIPDPLKPMRLDQATDFLGTCEDMCPEWEREEREYQKAVDALERYPGTNRIDPAKAVKAFHRPAAGNDQPLPSDVRPPRVLKRTLDYLFYDVLPNHPIHLTHPFLRDRTRAVRQDFTMQNERGALAIECNERIARYHVLALGTLREQSGFSESQELEQLRKVLKSLNEFYDDARISWPRIDTPNEAEFRSYNILTHLRDPDIIWSTELLPLHVFNHPMLQTALSLHRLAQKSNIARGERASPNAFSRFFKVVASLEVPYLFACILSTHFGEVRKNALEAMRSAFLPQHSLYPLHTLAKILGCDDDVEVSSICETFGIIVIQTETGRKVAELHKNAVMLNGTVKGKVSQRLVESKRGSTSYQDVIDGVNIAVHAVATLPSTPSFGSPVTAKPKSPILGAKPTGVHAGSAGAGTSPFRAGTSPFGHSTATSVTSKSQVATSSGTSFVPFPQVFNSSVSVSTNDASVPSLKRKSPTPLKVSPVPALNAAAAPFTPVSKGPKEKVAFLNPFASSPSGPFAPSSPFSTNSGPASPRSKDHSSVVQPSNVVIPSITVSPPVISSESQPTSVLSTIVSKPYTPVAFAKQNAFTSSTSSAYSGDAGGPGPLVSSFPSSPPVSSSPSSSSPLLPSSAAQSMNTTESTRRRKALVQSLSRGLTDELVQDHVHRSSRQVAELSLKTTWQIVIQSEKKLRQEMVDKLTKKLVEDFLHNHSTFTARWASLQAMRQRRKLQVALRRWKDEMDYHKAQKQAELERKQRFDRLASEIGIAGQRGPRIYGPSIDYEEEWEREAKGDEDEEVGEEEVEEDEEEQKEGNDSFGNSDTILDMSSLSLFAPGYKHDAEEEDKSMADRIKQADVTRHTLWSPGTFLDILAERVDRAPVRGGDNTGRRRSWTALICTGDETSAFGSWLAVKFDANNEEKLASIDTPSTDIEVKITGNEIGDDISDDDCTHAGLILFDCTIVDGLEKSQHWERCRQRLRSIVQQVDLVSLYKPALLIVGCSTGSQYKKMMSAESVSTHLDLQACEPYLLAGSPRFLLFDDLHDGVEEHFEKEVAFLMDEGIELRRERISVPLFKFFVAPLLTIWNGTVESLLVRLRRGFLSAEKCTQISIDLLNTCIQQSQLAIREVRGERYIPSQSTTETAFKLLPSLTVSESSSTLRETIESYVHNTAFVNAGYFPGVLNGLAERPPVPDVNLIKLLLDHLLDYTTQVCTEQNMGTNQDYIDTHLEFAIRHVQQVAKKRLGPPPPPPTPSPLTRHKMTGSPRTRQRSIMSDHGFANGTVTSVAKTPTTMTTDSVKKRKATMHESPSSSPSSSSPHSHLSTGTRAKRQQRERGGWGSGHDDGDDDEENHAPYGDDRQLLGVVVADGGDRLSALGSLMQEVDAILSRPEDVVES